MNPFLLHSFYLYFYFLFLYNAFLLYHVRQQPHILSPPLVVWPLLPSIHPSLLIESSFDHFQGHCLVSLVFLSDWFPKPSNLHPDQASGSSTCRLTTLFNWPSNSLAYWLLTDAFLAQPNSNISWPNFKHQLTFWWLLSFHRLSRKSLQQLLDYQPSFHTH